MSDAFNRDGILHDTFKKLVEDNGIEVVIETGTYHGKSTKAFCDMGVEVYSVDSNETYLNMAAEYLKGAANLTLASSPDFLAELLPKLKGKKILMFLDAHWEHHCPLIDELETIAACGIEPIIAIHDFKVPNKDFGFDVYHGQEFTWEWIAPSVQKIYDKFTHYYNTEAEGARRGVVFIEPR
jgi:hypothetical protein